MAIDKFESRGIVLSEIKYGESSKIIRVFTRERGKISVMAKGAYRNKSSLLSVTQPFCMSEYQFQKGQNFYYIRASELVSSHLSLRSSYERLIYASFFMELVEKSFLEELPNQKVYDLLAKALDCLEKTDDILGLTLAFELKYLTFIGYRPKLFVGEENYFSTAEGVIHEEMYGTNPVLREDVYYLQSLLYTSLDEKILYEESRKDYLHQLFLRYIKYNLDIGEFHSLKLI